MLSAWLVVACQEFADQLHAILLEFAACVRSWGGAHVSALALASGL